MLLQQAAAYRDAIHLCLTQTCSPGRCSVCGRQSLQWCVTSSCGPMLQPRGTETCRAHLLDGKLHAAAAVCHKPQGDADPKRSCDLTCQLPNKQTLRAGPSRVPGLPAVVHAVFVRSRHPRISGGPKLMALVPASLCQQGQLLMCPCIVSCLSIASCSADCMVKGIAFVSRRCQQESKTQGVSGLPGRCTGTSPEACGRDTVAEP